MIRGVRGAITIRENQEEEIVSSTEELLVNMIELNRIAPDSVASIFISATEDINAAFPAKGLHRINGWTYVPVMCMREIPVPGSLKMCIRIMLHVNTSTDQDKLIHVYLREAKVLRPDLNNI
jgi:chorismate mutase